MAAVTVVILEPKKRESVTASTLSPFFCCDEVTRMDAITLSSVQFSCSVESNSLWAHEPQHTRPPCPSPTPWAYSNSCPLSCDAIQPSHPLSSPTPPTFNLFQHHGLSQMSQFFTSGGQSIGVSASASVLPMNIQVWFPLEWTGWVSLVSRGLSRVFSNTTVQKHQLFSTQLSL